MAKGKTERILVSVLPEEAGGPPPEKDLADIKTESELEIGGFKLKCQVLSDGRRIIEKKGCDKILDYVSTGGSILPSEAKKIADFLKGFGL